MERYNNYCTEEQTKRALKLNAPLEKVIEQDGREVIYTLQEDDEHWSDCDAYYIPTTQQMLGWLRYHYLDIMIEPFPTADFKLSYYASIYNTANYLDGSSYGCIFADSNADRNKLELAAIDAALDYLEKGKAK